ncbi:MAG: hypothetical protein L0G87_00330 [Renibacterium salmoninarum]|nr:hypothetical protein [Renibacterium salmoninarum]
MKPIVKLTTKIAEMRRPVPAYDPNNITAQAEVQGYNRALNDVLNIIGRGELNHDK